MRQSSWNSISAWLRVLTKTSVVLFALDQLVDFVERMARGVAGPGQPLARVQHLHDRRRGAAGHDDVGGGALALAAAAPGNARALRLGDGRGQADAAQLRRELPQPRQPEREQIAALGGDQRMQFVEHDALQRGEQIRRIVGGEQQRKLLGRRQQNIRPRPVMDLGCVSLFSGIRVLVIPEAPRLQSMELAKGFEPPTG